VNKQNATYLSVLFGGGCTRCTKQIHPSIGSYTNAHELQLLQACFTPLTLITIAFWKR